MSLLRSWFQQRTAELPSWLPPQHDSRNSTHSAAAELIPSPSSPSSTNQSPVATGPSRSASQRPADPLLAMGRYEADIQRHLQSLLDAQGDGLLAGIGNNDADARSESDVASSAGARSTGLGKAVPIRQPAHKPLSLRAARKGIKNAMRELSAAKKWEADVYDEELAGDQETVRRITGWVERREGLTKEMDGIQSSEGSTRVRELHGEDSVLQEQITAIENQLMELKGQQNAVKLELSRIENSVQSKLSSYIASLKMLDKEVKEFLARPPQHPQRTSLEETSYFTLPAPRRTLDMALGHIKEEKRALEERQQTTREEREAIVEGIVVWDDTVKTITEFEHTLRRSIQALGANDSSRTEAASSMSELVDRMDQVMTDLDSKVKLAETRGWKLLVYCIGAELEALRQGRSILEQAQSSSDQSPAIKGEAGEEAATVLVQTGPRSESPGESPVRRSTDSFRRRNERIAPRAYRPEDDEPDPDLLITRTDTDTE